MQDRLLFGFVFISTLFQVLNTSQTFYNYDDYLDFEPEMNDEASFNTIQRPSNFILNGMPRQDGGPPAEPLPDVTECAQPTSSPNKMDQNSEEKARQLKNLVQYLYVAQARVQLEASEIKKAQAVANSAQQSLEEAASHVRAVTANLQSSQQEVAAAAIRAQTAQLQLAAHDQLLFAARQDVDALSTQLVGLQAAESITAPELTVDLPGLLDKLKQPLQDAEKPTPVPAVVQISTQAPNQQTSKLQHPNSPDCQHYIYY